MKPLDQIIQNLAGEPFSLRKFLRKNINGILTTIIFHLLILIVFLALKINSFREVKELGVVLDFTFEMENKDESKLSTEELAQLEMYERLLEGALRASNQPANISEQLENKISTENFVKEVEKLINESRSEEEKKKLQELEELLSADVPVSEILPEDLKNISVFQGPTRISYEFMEAPYERFGTYIPVPVYKCQGEGVVEVEIIVERSGTVSSAKPIVIGSPYDAACLAEAAVNYAKISRFTVNPGAPVKHKAKIRYSFVAQ